MSFGAIAIRIRPFGRARELDLIDQDDETFTSDLIIRFGDDRGGC
jgi:hypothetical protein